MMVSTVYELGWVVSDLTGSNLIEGTLSRQVGVMVVVAATVGGMVLIAVMAGVYGAGCGNDGVWWWSQ
jgi:hypothetical protein